MIDCIAVGSKERDIGKTSSLEIPFTHTFFTHSKIEKEEVEVGEKKSLLPM